MYYFTTPLKYIQLIILCIILGHVCPVDRSAFKTCDEAKFCKRHRRPSVPHPPYKALRETVRTETLSFTIILENLVHKRRLLLTLTSYGDNRIGVLIDEINGLRPRYRVNDSFAKKPIKRGFRDYTMGANLVTLTTVDSQKILLHFEPFRLDIIDDNDLVMTLNSQSLLKYEHFRKKDEKEEKKIVEQGGVGDASLPTGGESVVGGDPGRSPTGGEQQGNENIIKAAEAEGSGHVGEKTKMDESVSGDSLEEQSKDDEKLPPPPVIEGTEGQQQPKNDAEEAFFEEHYKSHFDSKPYGSSSVGMDISFVGFKHVYGIPEHADSFALKSTLHTEPYRLYNLDVFEYEVHNPMSLYGAVPYIVGHNEERTVGVLWLNPSETWIDIKSSVADKSIFRSLLDRFKSEPEVPQVDTHWISESGLIDIFLFFGPNPKDLFRQFTDFFGTMPLPPLFSIGYHQCRWNYNDMEDVQQVVAKFDDHDMPLDVMWLDIEHTDGKRYLTWDPRKFSDPKRMVENLESTCRKLVTIVDPHIKKDPDYFVYREANELGYFVKDRDNHVLDGWCWPGSSMYLDFFNPVVRDWWADKFAFDKYNGTTSSVHIWNDMNEPSVFNGPEVTMHKDCKHFGDWEHRDVHNMYGFYHHMATYKGLLKRTEGHKRPFILTRSFFLGSQRYTSVWTGDNTAEWSHLQITFPMLLSLSIAGIPFVGADVGGFFRNPEEELLVRWYQAAAFNPFYRAHAHIDTKRREPWLFSENAKNAIRDALRMRYQMLPYWYTVFYEHMVTGLPVLRPLWLEFPKDRSTFAEENAVLIGSSILARPVVEAGAASVSVYLPGEKTMWYDWDTLTGLLGPGATTVQTPMTKTPVFIRGGSVLPLKMRPKRSSCAMAHDPLTLYVALDVTGKMANGTYYFDDGETFDYQANVFCYRLFEYVGNEVSGVLSNKKISGDSCQTKVLIERVIVMGMKFKPSRIESGNKQSKLITFEYRADSRVLTIRKPDLNVGSDWSLQISSM